MEVLEERGGNSYSLLTSALDGDEWSESCPGCFTPGVKIPGTHWIGRMDRRSGLDADKKSPVPAKD